MIEILATVYLISMILSFSLVTWHYISTKRQLRSSRLKNLNRNLYAVGLYWSHSNGSFADLNAGSVEEDEKKSLRNVLWLALLGFFSVLGFLLLAAVIFSIRYLARSRLEVAVLDSALALQMNLPEDQVATLVEQFKSSYGLR
jgi:hypothetical protein